MRDHEKAREEERREERRAEEKDRSEGEEAGGPEVGRPALDDPARLDLLAGAARERRLAAVPLPAAVGSGAPGAGGHVPRLSRVLLVAVMIAVPAATDAEERPLRLVTFNLLHGGPWSSFTGDDHELEARLGMTIEQLRALEPDLVALQESSVTRRRGDVAARIAAALGLVHVHARATERVFGMRLLDRMVVSALGFVAGPAILSRFPITSVEIVDLPRCRRRIDPRVSLRADVQTPVGPLTVFSTHTARDDCQTRRVAELALAENGRPTLVMGDLNTDETSPVLAAFRDHGFVDLFRAANPTAPGHTVWQRIDALAPTVARRVDYVFLRPGGGGEADVVSSRVVLNTPRSREASGVLWPSDHYGVFVEVRLTARPARQADAAVSRPSGR
jgi:endonuclease/exonuclease/phosphatase family metal-dependent hydrolase